MQPKPAPQSKPVVKKEERKQPPPTPVVKKEERRQPPPTPMRRPEIKQEPKPSPETRTTQQTTQQPKKRPTGVFAKRFMDNLQQKKDNEVISEREKMRIKGNNNNNYKSKYEEALNRKKEEEKKLKEKQMKEEEERKKKQKEIMDRIKRNKQKANEEMKNQQQTHHEPVINDVKEISFNKVLVIDFGSFTAKVGFGGENGPRVVIPTIFGESKSNNNYGIMGNRAIKYYGFEAETRGKTRMLLKNIYRDSNNLYDSEILPFLKHINKNIEWNMNETPVVISVNRITEINVIRQLVKVLFEKLKVPAIYMVNSASASLYGSGRNTGVILESGRYHTYAVCIKDGRVLLDTIVSSNINGEEVAKQFEKSVYSLRKEYSNDLSVKRDIQNQLKDVCYVADDYDKETPTTTIFKRSDSIEFKVSDEKIEATEIMFQPSIAEIDTPSVVDIIIQSISNCEGSIQKEMYQNIVLTGGNTMYKGFAERIKKELWTYNKASNVIVCANRQYLTWVGCSYLSINSTVQNNYFLTKDDYEEKGIECIEGF